MTQAMGWTRTGISTAALVNWLAMGVGAFLWGALSDLGTRTVLLLGGGLLGLGLVTASQATTLGQFQLAVTVLSVAGLASLGGKIVCGLIADRVGAKRTLVVGLAEYFGARIMGTAFGAVALVSTLGLALGPPVGGWLYDTYGSYSWLYLSSFAIGLAAVAIASTFRPPGHLAPAVLSPSPAR